MLSSTSRALCTSSRCAWRVKGTKPGPARRAPGAARAGQRPPPERYCAGDRQRQPAAGRRPPESRNTRRSCMAGPVWTAALQQGSEHTMGTVCHRRPVTNRPLPRAAPCRPGHREERRGRKQRAAHLTNAGSSRHTRRRPGRKAPRPCAAAAPGPYALPMSPARLQGWTGLAAPSRHRWLAGVWSPNATLPFGSRNKRLAKIGAVSEKACRKELI